MVIGLLGIVVMMQVFSMAEAQKRTTSGSDDAISSGAISLNGIQRDIQQSGWGISAVQVIGCDSTGWASGATIPLTPITINPAGITGDVNTDTLLVVSGNGNGTVEGDLINSQPAGGDPFLTAVSPNVYDVHTAGSFTPGATAALGDKVVAVPATRPATCTLPRTWITGVNRPNVAVNSGVAGMVGGRLFNLGMLPTARVYAIRNNNLMVCDFTTRDCAADTSAMTQAQIDAIWVSIANNVVSLRAQYGRDTNAIPMDGIVDVWDRTTPTTACGWVRTSAIRIALVARSTQPEKTLDWPLLTQHVTPAAPGWAGSANIAITLPNVVSPSWATWQDFRYKVFETVVPLRNVTSLGVVTGC